jgi:acetolactate synthase-1/2/3 large subunit
LVIAVCGDGGFSMAINGLMTAIDEDIPVVTVILNNSALGWVKHGQGNRTINSSFANMDFAGIAEKMGCKGIRVEDPADLEAALRDALAANKPTVVDVITAFDGLSFRDVTTPLLQG